MCGVGEFGYYSAEVEGFVQSVGQVVGAYADFPAEFTVVGVVCASDVEVAGDVDTALHMAAN